MKTNSTVRSGFLLAALGMIYGDIATSPLYVFKFIVQGSGGTKVLSEELVLGALSLVLWSLLLVATVKGVLLLLRADNQGEGGLFALYALVRHRGSWLLIPAALGGAALLADSVLTPALTLTAAVEGSQSMVLGTFTGFRARGAVLLVLALLTVLFMLQGLGSRRTGHFLGPVMLVWLLFIGFAGAMQFPGAPQVLRAFDPRLGLRFLFGPKNPMGFALLGLVFLSVTGTEILYANLDFAGRKAISRTWPFVLLCLCLSYLGQGAWLIKQITVPAAISGAASDPFFGMLPNALRLPAFLLALAAAWGASQTVVNGSFTIVSEAIRLNLLPPLEIRYPSVSIRQEYIPAVNFLMWVFSCAAVVFFRSGQRMASVYGLTIAVAMLTTSVMLFVYFRSEKPGAWPARCVILLIGIMETWFLIAGLEKLLTGGMVTLLLTLLLLLAMISWNRAEEIERRFGTRLLLPRDGDRGSGDSLFHSGAGTKTRAGILLCHSQHGQRAECAALPGKNFGTEYAFRLRLELGYKCSRPLTYYLKDVFLDMERQGLVTPCRKNYCVSEDSALGTFHYCVLRKRASGAENFSIPELWALRMRNIMQGLAGLREEWYADVNNDVEVEWIPISLEEEAPVEGIRRLMKNTDDSAFPDKED